MGWDKVRSLAYHDGSFIISMDCASALSRSISPTRFIVDLKDTFTVYTFLMYLGTNPFLLFLWYPQWIEVTMSPSLPSNEEKEEGLASKTPKLAYSEGTPLPGTSG
jgi:hypothetical protein